MDGILVRKSDLEEIRRTSGAGLPELGDGQVRVDVESFGLTTNNVTYAVYGDALGYWAYFPAEEGWGSVPVWGFGRVVASRSTEIEVGERVFGYLPLASQLDVLPSATSALAFSDATSHRAALHPWYNRYYRCGADPLYSDAHADVQPILWALFMTGWMLADQLAPKVDGVVVSSASSKTALSLAWSMKRLAPSGARIGLTSEGNRSFVESLGVYTDVRTYDDLRFGGLPDQTAYVDIAGNGEVASAVHVALDGRLVDSVTLGATHRAPATEPLAMPGPAPRFFFIPDVAEERAAKDGLPAYHQSFTEAWAAFAPWASGWLDLERGHGPDAIEAAYRSLLAGGSSPRRGVVLSWQG